MAVFNPDAGGVPSPNMPDQTGASRGLPANRSFEALFSGIGDAVGGVTAAIDSDIKTSIRNDAVNIFEDSNKPYDLPPADLAKGTESVRTLQAAWEQGKLSDVHYYGLLNTELKSMRAKYPGYEDVVDSTIQEVTGVRPANAFRNAIISELNAQAEGMADTEKAWKTWENSNQSTIAFLYPDYFQQPDKYNRAEVRSEVARYQAVKENDKYIKDTNADAVYSTAAASLALDVNTTIGNLSKMMGLGDKNIYEVLEQAAKVNPSPDELLSMTSSLDLIIRKQEAAIDSQMLSTRESATTQPGDPPISWFGILGAAKAKEVKDAVLEPLRRIRSYISEGNFTLAAYNTQLIDAMKNKDVANLMTGPGGDYFRVAKALEGIDPELFQSWVATNPSARKNAYTDAIPGLLAQIANTSDKNTNEVANTIANDTTMSEADRAAALTGLINGVNTTLASGSKATGTQVDQTVANTYSKDSDGDIFDLVEDADYMSVYTRMFDTKVTENIKANGSSESFKTYRDAAIDRFQSVPEFRNAAAALKNFIEIDDNLKVTTDKDGQLIVSMTPTDTGENRMLNRALNDSRVTAAQNAIQALNQSFRLLDPILLPDGAGTDEKTKLHQEMLELLSVQLGAGKQQDFFDWLGTNVLSLLEAGNEIGARDVLGLNPSQDIAFDLPDTAILSDDSLTQYFSNIRSAESGGNDLAKNPDSSATGRYQVLTSTWNQYADRLGLTDRTDPAQQEKFIRAFTADNENILRSSGIEVNNGTRYAAHFLGATAAVDVLSASDTSKVSDLVPPRVIKANRFLKGMTVAQFKRWAASKAS